MFPAGLVSMCTAGDLARFKMLEFSKAFMLHDTVI
jgi:hypothetical protein